MEDKKIAKEAFELLLSQTRKTQTEAAELLGTSQSALANKLSRGSLRLEEVLRLCDLLGYRIIWVPKEAKVQIEEKKVVYPSRI